MVAHFSVVPAYDIGWDILYGSGFDSISVELSIRHEADARYRARIMNRGLSLVRGTDHALSAYDIVVRHLDTVLSELYSGSTEFDIDRAWRGVLASL